jgi:hypothetical protein
MKTPMHDKMSDKPAYMSIGAGHPNVAIFMYLRFQTAPARADGAGRVIL